MAVGASKPTVLADKDGFFSVKNKMLVSYMIISFSCQANLIYEFVELIVNSCLAEYKRFLIK